jgi:SanA protein
VATAIRRSLLRLALILGLLSLVGSALLVLPRVYSALRYAGQIHDEPTVPAVPVAIVFGAGLQPDGTPTLILADRVATAAGLYHAGKVQVLLLSGDNRIASYNEPQAMYEYAEWLGVPAAALVRDYAGRRTYDTCRRARDVFHVTEAVLVTQRYHLDRALLTCEGLGLHVTGVPADLSRYPPHRDWLTREFPATAQAVWDVFVMPPANVVLGEPLPIATGRSTGAVPSS